MARARLAGRVLQGWHAPGAERTEIPGTAKIGEAQGPETGSEERRKERGERRRTCPPTASRPHEVQRFALRFNPSIRSILSMAPLVERSERLARDVLRLASPRLRATLCFAFEPREGDRSGPTGIDRTGTDRRGAPWSIHAT